MDNLVTGQCLCGAVAFQIMAEFESFFLCHCSRCRKGSGSAHSANLFSSKAKLDWLSGQEMIKVFQLSGSRHVTCFCTNCGSALPILQEPDGAIVVPAGSLDSPISLRPDAHISMASRAPWDNNLDTITRMDGLPG
jgi:hypothetical protein